MQRRIEGDWKSVWTEDCEMEKRRSKRRHAGNSANLQEEKLIKKWDRIKRLVNDGELSKAAREIDSAGVAEPTEEVISELRQKYPKRKE